MKKDIELIKITPNNFVRFFVTKGIITCLHSEFLLTSSLGKGMLVIHKDKDYYTFISKNNLKYFSKEGLCLYGNEARFKRYLKDFKDYVNKANKEIISKYNKTPEILNRREFIKIRNFLAQFWYYYGFVEFPYQEIDLDSLDKNKAKTVKNNLLQAAKFKFHGRELLNNYFFKGGVFENLLKYFLKYDYDGRFLYSNEILNIFDGKKIPKNLIEQRKKCYSAINQNNSIKTFSYKQSLELYKNFTLASKTTILKGRTAFKGKVVGRAIIAPMFYDIKKVKLMDKQMKKGDILIAESTSPDWLPLCKKASAIVADQGGMLSHAAIVSRELKIPCIIDTKEATKIFKNGDKIEVDADNGVVKKIS
ncbi:MAG: PEP-utilizing enzyme [Patescibacteria group bacterium]|jgi:phosphoenolpyruvate synthase/pyruvate phosphate dikinase